MSFEEDLEAQLIRHEGFRKNVYRCSAGKLTLGIGRLIEPPGGISREEALYLLRNDIAKVVRELRANLGWFDTLSEARKRVLIDMGFNLGIGGLLKFGGTLEAVKAGRYADAARHMLDSKWARQVGNRAKYLAYLMEYDREE